MNTTGRCDVTPIFQDPKVFSNLIKDMIKPFNPKKIDKIVGLDALGFILGGAIALKMKKGFVPIRKGGKLPGKEGSVVRVSTVDYTHKEKAFEINKDSIGKGERILVVDEWIETGAQMKAAINLIEKLGGKIEGISAIHIDRSPKTEELFDKYNCHALRVEVKNVI